MKKLKVIYKIMGPEGPEGLMLEYGEDTYTYKDPELTLIEDASNYIIEEVTKAEIKKILKGVTLKEIQSAIVESKEDETVVEDEPVVEKDKEKSLKEIAANARKVKEAKSLKNKDSVKKEVVKKEVVESIKEDFKIEEINKIPTFTDIFTN